MIRAAEHRIGARRGGFTMLEVTVGAIALALTATCVVQATVALERSRRAAEHMDYASRELDNLLERFVHRPWESVTQQAADAVQPPGELVERYPGARLETIVMQQTEPVDSKRVTMRLRWRSGAGAPARPLVLTAWKFRTQEDTP